MKKMILKLATLMSVLAFVMASCNNEPAFGEHNENQKEKLELLQIAKSMVESQDGTVPLPVNGGGEAQSRSAMSLITSGTPLWDYVKYYNIDGMHVIMVELQTAERVFSRVTSTTDGVTTTQENETFSRLVIRKKADKLYAQVLTYMPDNEYATANQAKLDTIGYYPKYVDFTGITLTSNLDGSVFRGVRYENGRVAGIITKPEHSECDHDHGTCSHSQDAEHTRPININLYTQSSQEPLSRSGIIINCPCGKSFSSGTCRECGWGFGSECPKCKLGTVIGGMCMICGYIESELCDDCGKLLIDCICEGKCPTCGKSSCKCPNPDFDTETFCPYCSHKKELCTCDKVDDGGSSTPSNPSRPSYPNTPSTNEQEPVLFSNNPNSDATFAISDMPLMMKTQDGMASLTAIMTYIDNELLGGMRDVLQFDAYYDSEFNGSSNGDGVRLVDAQEFIDAFFITTTFDTFQFALADRNVVVSTFPGSDLTYPHYVLVVGRESDGDLVYINPYDGEAYLLDEDLFENCEKIVVRII